MRLTDEQKEVSKEWCTKKGKRVDNSAGHGRGRGQERGFGRYHDREGRGNDKRNTSITTLTTEMKDL